MKQTTVFGAEVELHPEPTVKPELTDRQQHALEFVRRSGRAGASVDEVGAAWCAHRGKHSDDTRCEWDGQSGRDVLKALRKKGKVKSRRDGSWYALEGVVEPELATAAPKLYLRDDGTEGDIPF